MKPLMFIGKYLILGRVQHCFFGEKYYLRAGSSLVVAVFVIEGSGYTVVKIFSTGGKSGLLDLTDWGVSRSYVRSIIGKLSKYLKIEARRLEKLSTWISVRLINYVEYDLMYK